MIELSSASLDELLSQLDLPTKIRLLTGRDFWSTWPVPEIGLRSMVLSDGPSGVRGPVWDERSPSMNLPSATALAAAWDQDLAREYGSVAAAEARRKGVDVVLGPTINLHRSPLAGRHFEAFSEDPRLTATLASAYVAGVQGNGVAATPKHYIANDFETDRFTADVEVSDRVLREIYLLAFEGPVKEAKPWALMSAYNSINGVTASENDLLESPLNVEWGFDGVVVSDWTAVRSIASARASQDLEMPGPEGAWGNALLEAVERGDVPIAAIDRKVRRLLLLAARVGALDLDDANSVEKPHPTPDPTFPRRAEAAGIVMVQNDGILPLTSPTRIAVIGHNAASARSQGGGSATVLPERVISPLQGIRSAFTESIVDYALGAIVQEGVADLPLDQLKNPVTGGSGVHLRYIASDGSALLEEDRFATSYVWFGGSAPVQETSILEITTSWTPEVDESVQLGFAAVGHAIVEANGEVVVDAVAEPVGTDLGAALLSPPSRTGEFAAVAGKAVQIRVRYMRTPSEGGLAGAMAFAFGLGASKADPDTLIAEAEAVAAAADVVVLVVGTNSAVESEGCDRADLRLPGAQDELARAVLAANPRTVVVVNSGAPVELPWVAGASAVLLTWFGGQDYGSALADVLSGVVEPGGRLPTTWPAAIDDVPVLNVTPHDGRLAYSEGIHIGYRAWLRSHRTPKWWFGHGLGYTTFESGPPRLAVASLRKGESVRVDVEIRNVGTRVGKHVVQLYASRAESAVERPRRWLVGFATVNLSPDEQVEVAIEVPWRALAHWTEHGWALEAGTFVLSIAESAGLDGKGVEVEAVTPHA